MLKSLVLTLEAQSCVFLFLSCHREDTEAKSVAPEAPKENAVRPRKRKADVAIVSSLDRLAN